MSLNISTLATMVTIFLSPCVFSQPINSQSVVTVNFQTPISLKNVQNHSVSFINKERQQASSSSQKTTIGELNQKTKIKKSITYGCLKFEASEKTPINIHVNFNQDSLSNSDKTKNNGNHNLFFGQEKAIEYKLMEQCPSSLLTTSLTTTKEGQWQKITNGNDFTVTPAKGHIIAWKFSDSTLNNIKLPSSTLSQSLGDYKGSIDFRASPVEI